MHIVVSYVSGIGPEKGVDLATELVLKVRLPTEFQEPEREGISLTITAFPPYVDAPRCTLDYVCLRQVYVRLHVLIFVYVRLHMCTP
jgi:hypothetical protein